MAAAKARACRPAAAGHDERGWMPRGVTVGHVFHRGRVLDWWWADGDRA